MGILRRMISEKKYLFLAVFMVCLLLSLSRYIVNGEPRVVAADDAAGETIALYEGVEVVWPITITEDMNWREGYYALMFTDVLAECTGTLCFRMTQGDYVEEVTLAVSEIPANEFCPLPLTMTALKSGQASLSVSAVGVKQGELALGCGPDYYGFGEAVVNAQATGYTLTQKYYWHITDWEYYCRVACYLFVVFGCLGILLLIRNLKAAEDETPGRCAVVFCIMTGVFLAIFFIYDSSVIIEPTYAEAVSNFLKYAREESFMVNILISDAGYLPLLPRLITIFLITLLRIPAGIALYGMQFTACLCCCMIWAFFTLHPFRGILGISERIIFCFVIMAVCFYDETVFFTNFVYWGILLIFLFVISDMDQWRLSAYSIITLGCSLVCLSKGAYVIMLPFMAVCLLVFWKSMGRRDKVFAFCLMGASLLQMVYSFGGNGDGGSWVDSTGDMGQIAYWCRLLVRVCSDVTGYFFHCLGVYARRLDGIFPVLTVLICGMVVGGFVWRILLPFIRREQIQTKWRILYTLILFQFATSAFYRITVKSVPEEWENVCKVVYEQSGNKYEIFSAVTAFLIWIILFSIIGERYGRVKTSAVVILVLSCFLCCPRLQLTGIGNTAVSDSRTYEGDIGAGWKQTSKLILNDEFFVPVRENFWSYCKNVTVFQVGEERYFEESQGINLGNMEEGYRSEYVLDEGMSAENVIEVWIRTPNRIAVSLCRATLLDAQGNVLQESTQFTSDRNFRTGFWFSEPVNGIKTIRFTDEEGQEVYIDDYICWITAW